MESAAALTMDISLSPETLDEGSPEEKACFGLLTIRADGTALTEGYDSFIRNLRPGPLVSGYHAAEWLAWYWWRLRWEPRTKAPEWWRAHKMTAIGEGYAWPTITILSDGVRTALISQPSVRPDAKPFRYIGANVRVVASSLFEAALDGFVGQMQGRLREANIMDSNLDRIWLDLRAERSDSDTARYRKFEALLGFDPDGGDPAVIERLLGEAKAVGDDGMEEIAADHSNGGSVIYFDDLRRIARSNGFEASRAMTFLQHAIPAPVPAGMPAWRVGATTAQSLREEARLGTDGISDDRLADLAGVRKEALERSQGSDSPSFVLNEGISGSRIVLRSKWNAGRRFELARLIGDRLMNPAGGALFPATRSHTFRQKAQRSFAAELLAPIDEVIGILDGDTSEEARQDVAHHFQVSELTIRTLLVNHGRLERDDLDDTEPGIAA
jgi:hypothetical protein